MLRVHTHAITCITPIYTRTKCIYLLWKLCLVQGQMSTKSDEYKVRWVRDQMKQTSKRTICWFTHSPVSQFIQSHVELLLHFTVDVLVSNSSIFRQQFTPLLIHFPYLHPSLLAEQGEWVVHKSCDEHGSSTTTRTQRVVIINTTTNTIRCLQNCHL